MSGLFRRHGEIPPNVAVWRALQKCGLRSALNESFDTNRHPAKLFSNCVVWQMSTHFLLLGRGPELRSMETS